MGVQYTPVNGLLVFDPRLVDTSHLAPNTGGALESSYTQAGSIPGVVAEVPSQSLVPTITNGQGDEVVKLRVQRSGHAGRCAVAYKLDNDAARGWAGVKPIGWESLQYTSSDTYAAHASVVLPRTQTVVTVYAVIGTGSVYSQRRTPDDETWTSQVTVTTSSARRLALYVIERDDGGYRLVCLRIDTSNRLSTYYSDDEGTTWDVLATAGDVGVTLSFTPNENPAFCRVRGELALFVTEPGPTLHQYASADGGVSWDLIESTLAYSGTGAATMPDGSGVVVYRDSSGSAIEVRRIGGAYQALSTAPPASTGLIGGEDNAIVADGADVWLLNKANDHNLNAYVSRDGLLTFSGGAIFASGLVANGPTNIGAVTAAGRILMLHNNTSASASFDGSLSVLKLSSWSSVEWTETPTETWLPFYLPSALTSWTFAGATAGSLTLAHMRIQTAASSGSYTYTAAAPSTTPAAHFIASCTVGGSVSSQFVIASAISCDGSDTYELRLLFSTTQVAIVDSNAPATIATINLDMTLDWEFLVAFTAKGVPYVAYKRPNDSLWTVPDLSSYGALTSTGAGSAAWSFRFGHLAPSTSTSWWRAASVYDDVGSIGSGADLNGKILSAAPYPLADCVDADGNVAHISVRGGIGLQAEEYTIAPRYRYPIEDAFVGLSPGPTREWRSAANTEQIVCFDLLERSYLGDGIGLFLRTNAKTAYLEYHDGTSWQTAATYNGAQGLESDEFTLTGEVIEDVPAVVKSSRAALAMELARGRGWALLDASEGRYIRDNTGGYYTDESPTVSLTVTLDGVGGTTPSSGSVSFVTGEGVLFCYPSTRILRRYWRVRFPAQITPDGFLRCSGLGLGRLMPFGRPWAWGATRGESGQYDAFTDYAGTETRRRRGANKRRWGIFFDPSPEQDLLADSDHDYVGVTSGGSAIPLEPLDSVPQQLSAVLEKTEGQRLPVVALGMFFQVTATMTGRDRFLFGYLSGSLDVTHERGTDGFNAVRRVGNMLIEEVV